MPKEQVIQGYVAPPSAPGYLPQPFPTPGPAASGSLLAGTDRATGEPVTVEIEKGGSQNGQSNANLQAQAVPMQAQAVPMPQPMQQAPPDSKVTVTSHRQ